MRYQSEVTVEAEHYDAQRELPKVFGPEVLLPAQYAQLIRGRHLLRGEQRLMFGVLEDAIDCFTKYLDRTHGQGEKLFREAEEWITRHDHSWLFSFDNVCEFLDLNPDYLRHGLECWKRQQRAAVAVLDTRSSRMWLDARTGPVGRRKLGSLIAHRRRLDAQSRKSP